MVLNPNKMWLFIFCIIPCHNLNNRGMTKKSDLAEKTCVVCGRPFAWRKKWEKVWEEVKYCSESCRRNKNQKHHETHHLLVQK